ncbi:MAG TPA: DNA-3-methyladenine glycosylase I, partial [Usitatibacter sp.]
MAAKRRCKWAESDELLMAYHDAEWGVPMHDDRVLFEMLNLEGAQAGLSWLIILRKRDHYRKAFDRFDAAKIARYGAAKKASLMKNEGIVRNRLKIAALVENAKAFLEVQREFGSFDRYIWQFVGGKPLSARARKSGMAKSALMSKDLK